MLLPTVLANSVAYTITVILALCDPIIFDPDSEDNIQQVSDARAMLLIQIPWVASIYTLLHPCLVFYKCPKLRIFFSKNAVAPHGPTGGQEHRINPEQNDKILNVIWNRMEAATRH